jgi:hypothetical protein
MCASDVCRKMHATSLMQYAANFIDIQTAER